MTANVTGYSVLVGLTGGLSTQAGIAKGANDDDALVLALQRTTLLAMLICVPISLVWFNARDIVLALGQSEEIASSAGKYICILIPGLWCFAISAVLQTFMYAQSDTRIIAMFAAAQTLIHPVINYVFIFTWNLGWTGAAWATTVSKAMYMVFLLVHLHRKYIPKLPQIRVWSLECTRGLGPLLNLALPNVLMMAEWWASEVIIFASGYLADPELQVGAMSVIQNTNSICFMLPAGVQVSGSTRISNFLGSGDASAARLSTVTTTLLATTVALFSCISLLMVRDFWGTIFTSDPDVVALISQLLVPLSVYVLADALQGGLTGVIKGTGKQYIGGPVVLVAYYVIGLPLAFYMAFDLDGHGLNYGAMGLCIGTVVGTWTHMSIYLYISRTVDWDDEVKTAMSKIGRSERPSLEYAPLDNPDKSLLDDSDRPIVDMEMQEIES